LALYSTLHQRLVTLDFVPREGLVMKKFALAIMTTSIVIFGFGAAASAQDEGSVNTPPNKDVCMQGGWESYTDDEGTPFENQGDCVSYVAAGGGVYPIVASQPPPASPTVSVSSPTPAPASTITVTMDGCAEGESVQFTVAGETASGVTTDGSASAPIKVPTTPGAYTGTATCAGGASATFSITVTMNGCAEGETVQLVLVGETATGVTTGGSASAQIKVPTTPGTYTGTATCASGASANFTITVTSPSGGLPATGSSGLGSFATISMILLLVGAGLLVVSQVRRRNPVAT
jgi:hypothetical protein